MESGFPYGDIIVIAAVAVFIILRYRAMLGEPRGRDERGVPTVVPVVKLERVAQLPAARQATPDKKPDDAIRSGYATQADTLIAMRAIDREFSPDEFMTGAKTAYEMVIGAFSKRNRDTLKMLLSDALFQQFDQALKDEEAARRHTDTTLVAITRATLSAATLSGNQATITVEFSSEQIHLMRDETGSIVEGDVRTQNKVEDRWVFTRDLRSTSPNWVVIET